MKIEDFISISEARLREVEITSGKIVQFGSKDHVTDLEKRINDLTRWRDKYRKGSEARANYARIINRLKNELKSAYKTHQKEKSKKVNEGHLFEGGLVGHLAHLYDNRNLTFNDIKTVLRKASTGRLEQVSEKLDGMNLVFSYDVTEDQVKVVRNNSEIKSGGMDAATLASKFTGRGSVEEAFNTAFRVLQDALSTLPEKVKKKVFGPEMNRWYSIEIIYTKNPNVINYDSDNIVFHGWPVFEKSSADKVEMVDDDIGGIEILENYINKMQKAVSASGWKIRGPAIVRMRDLSNGTIYQDTVSRIDAAKSNAGVEDRNTLEDYLISLLSEDVNVLELDDKTKQMVVDRCIGVEGAPTLVDIKKKLDKSKYSKVNEFVKNSPALLKSYIRPIELAINDFAVEVLKGLDSTLIDDSGKEVERIRNITKDAINSIQTTGDEAAMSVLKTQMEKLKSVENITSPIEGVVFIYKGNAYKFTGSFASASQILGLFKYGRKGTKT